MEKQFTRISNDRKSFITAVNGTIVFGELKESDNASVASGTQLTEFELKEIQNCLKTNQNEDCSKLIDIILNLTSK